MQPVPLAANGLAVRGWLRAEAPGTTLAVYLEGDGRAWVTRSRLAMDPTPEEPIALRLAAADPAPNVLYLARPCQFLSGAERHGCAPSLWSEARYGSAVLDAVDRAVTRARDAIGARSLELIGYSGGGAVAALLAERRRDVALLVTVAGNLDTEAWTRLHGVSPLSLSANPADGAAALAALPQLHLAGGRDEVVPPAILRSFMAHLPAGAPARLEIVAEFDHECCWGARWPSLVAAARSGAALSSSR
jgi:pimeloyl-ACP methyl ester carboxylesterase